MSGIKYLNFIGDVFAVPASLRQRKIRKYADLFELTDNLGQPVSAYSHGMKQKLAVIAAWLHSPKLIVMDEPFVGLGGLYFLVMGSVGLALGAFGSVFNTYSSLYLAKDNDLLLSLPIPAGTIMAARLVNVYLLGTMYVSTVLVPTIIVYWSVAGVSFARVICGILFFLIVTGIVLLLSCLLGLVVAKLSQRIKNKSFIAALATLLFIGGYYYFYFKVNDLIQEIILKADIYGEKIKGGAYGLYLFGRIGEGDLFPAVIFTAVTAVLFALVWILMQRSFLKIATASGQTEKVRYKERGSAMP